MSSKFLFLLFPISFFAERGDLISYTKKAQVSPVEHKSLCNAFSIDCANAKTSDVYTFKYETVALDNTKARASGVLIVPQKGRKQTLLAYLHGTVSDKEGAPSKLGYHMQLPLSVFSQGGFNIVIPDYLGIGDSSLIFHPFCHAASLASASYDAIVAAKELMKQLSLEIVSELFVSGYSEGGMAALSLHRYLENNPIQGLSFKASCPMSGPYDLSSSLSFVLNSTSPRMNTYISYVISSYNLIYPQILPPFSEVFSQDINYMIPLLFDGCHAFWQINSILNKINPLLNPQFVKSTLGQKSAFIDKLKENNTYDFVPKTPVHFIALENDTEVGYLNTLQAYNFMKKAKAPVSLENASSALDHMQGSPLCHEKALKFFQNLK